MLNPAVQIASFDDIPKIMLYKVLRLRSAIFGVEQNCVYQDLDDHDFHPSTRHFWIEEDSEPLVTLRTMVAESGALEIGRVCTDPKARGRGLAATLVRKACEDTNTDVTLDAQSYLQQWYERLGFHVAGEEFMLDGIPHIAMRLGR